MKRRLWPLLKPNYQLALMLAVGAAARWLNIAKSSIWHDEGFTMMLSPMSPAQIIARTARDVHPPLYYLALHYWMQVFGNSATAARSLSAVFGLALVPVVYLLAKHLFGEKVGLLAAWLTALAPFIVRYSQEARMYAMVAFLIAAGTYCLVRALDDHRLFWWAGWSALMAAALYTHYYAIFGLVVQGIYVVIRTDWNNGRGGLFEPWLWVFGFVALALFMPWVPKALGQFTRVQASFWIPPVTIKTIPGSIFMFLVYQAYGPAPAWFHAVVLLLLVVVSLASVWRTDRKARSGTWLVTLYAFLPLLLVWMLSLKRPIYQDRYFVFAAAGFAIWLAAAVFHLTKDKGWWRHALIVILAATSVYGIGQVYASSNHQMAKVGAYVNQRYKPGDAIISGELYTYFDYSYYNHTGYTAKLLNADSLNGYNESSLIYDRQDQIVVHKYSDLHPASGVVWLIGKPGQKDYYNVPANWHLVSDFVAGACEARQYMIK